MQEYTNRSFQMVIGYSSHVMLVYFDTFLPVKNIVYDISLFKPNNLVVKVVLAHLFNKNMAREYVSLAINRPNWVIFFHMCWDKAIVPSDFRKCSIQNHSLDLNSKWAEIFTQPNTIEPFSNIFQSVKTVRSIFLSMPTKENYFI